MNLFDKRKQIEMLSHAGTCYIQSLKRSTFPLERWANAERERSANASAKWTMNARWTQDERSIRKASCVFLSTKYLIPSIPR